MRLSEFSRLTGLKRTTLQLYDRKGLLKPVSRSEGGYWEYDGNSLGRATLITIMKEAGYPLDEIGRMLGSDVPGNSAEMQELMAACEERLNRKIRKLQEYLRYIHVATMTAEDHYLIELILQKVDFAEVLEKTGGVKNEMDQYGEAETLKEKVLNGGEQPDDQTQRFVQAILFIGLLMGKEPPEGPTAQETLHRVFDFANTHSGINGIHAETAGGFVKSVKEALLDALPEEAVVYTEQKIGKGSINYIRQALDAFGRAEG